MLARFAAWTGLVCWLTPAPAWAQPLNLADPTPRTIKVQFEISLLPTLIGQTYSASYTATYSATGNIGTVVIPRAVYESAIQTHDLDYFGYPLIAGSAADFTLEIDLTTLEATAQPLAYQVFVTYPPDAVGTITRNLSTTAIAGFGYSPSLPGFPFFTTTPCGVCALVPGAPYDPATGKLNAVGSDALDSPDLDVSSFARAGDLRLSESATPSVPALSSYGLAGLVVALASFAFLVNRRKRRSPRDFQSPAIVKPN